MKSSFILLASGVLSSLTGMLLRLLALTSCVSVITRSKESMSWLHSIPGAYAIFA